MPSSGASPGSLYASCSPAASSGAFEERHALVEHAGIARRTDVLGNDVRQPQQIVGAASAKAPAGRLVPPVLDVAFHELPPGSPQDVFARQVRSREQQRHHVLQLIAEPERAAGLIVATPRPQPATDGLVEQPPVGQRIEGVVRCSNVDGVQYAVP